MLMQAESAAISLSSILAVSSEGIDLTSIAICTAASLVLGIVIACVYMFRNVYTKNFVVTLALLPVLVQAVIMMVNGNLGTGVAILGAFSLVRFRSVPGSAKEIASVFFSMAIGLATGMGYVTFAALFTVVVSAAMLLLALIKFGETAPTEKTLKITIPETLDYQGAFDDLFEIYTRRCTLDKVKTTNMGSLYELQYSITLKDAKREKEFIDDLRCRNGNLNIICSRASVNREEL